MFKISKKTIFIALIFIILIMSTMIYSFYNLGKFFCMDNFIPQKADLIFIMSGYNKERADTAAELYKKGIADKILVCKGGLSNDLLILGINLYGGDLQKRELMNQGVWENAIIISNKTTTSSYEDILCLKEYLNTHPEIKNILIVTSPYHKRRVYYIASKFLKDKNFEVVSYDYDCSEWYKKEKDVLWVWKEMLKLFYYILKY